MTKVPYEPKTASVKAMWIAKVIDRSLNSASCEAKIVSDCKTILALHRVKPRLSCEARPKALCANNHQHYWAVLGSSLATKPKH